MQCLVEFSFGLQMRALVRPRQCVICETHVGKMERRDQVRPYDVFRRRCMMSDTIDGQLPICAECETDVAPGL
jgi:hypothetical protein